MDSVADKKKIFESKRIVCQGTPIKVNSLNLDTSD